MKSRQLDATDVKILSILQREGRIKFQNLAEKVALSASPCLSRVHRLETEGFIKGYMARLDMPKLRNHIEVVSEITLLEQGNHRQKTFVTYVRALPELIELLEISGRSDYMARFACATLGDYQLLVDKLIENSSLRISNVTSHIVMRAVVEFTGYDLAPLLAEHEGRD